MYFRFRYTILGGGIKISQTLVIENMKVEKHDTESAYRDYYMTMSSCLPVGTRRSATH